MRYVAPRQIVVDDNPADVSFWEPDRSYEGQTVVLVGGGPSHASCSQMLRGHRFIAINSSCRAVRNVATADDMHPQGDIRRGDVPPQHVQPFVPVVQHFVVGGLEACTVEAEHLDVVASLRPYDMRRELHAIWDSESRRQLAPQGSGTLHVSRTVATALRRPCLSGRSSSSGL